MASPQVSIRLSTDGKAQVQRDFADIGDAGDAAAKRVASAFERDAAAAEAALNKLAKTRERMAALSSGATNMVNPVTGGSYAQMDGAAQASARAMQQQFTEGEAAARRLLAAIDPLFAAEMRYKAALDEVRVAELAGALQGQQLAQVKLGLKAQYDQEVATLGQVSGASGNARLAQMEFMHAVRGSADQLAAGAPPAQVFAMHIAMLSQSAQLAGGSLGAVGEFLSSGWGVALTLAVAVLAPLASKLFETGESVDSLVEKLKKEAAQSGMNDQAHALFANTIDGVTEALRKNREALDHLSDSDKTAAQRALDNAEAQLKKAAAIRATTVALLEHLKAEYSEAQQQTFGAAGGAGAGMATALYAGQAQDVQKQLDQANADLADAKQQVAEARSLRAVELGQQDAVAKIKDHYKTLVEQTRVRLLGEKATSAEIERQTRALADRERAEIKAAEAADHNPAANAGGAAIADNIIARFFDIASSYRGRSEHSASDRGVLEAFFREANLNLDPEKTAWCAAFVNAVLAAGGVKGNGSLAARSFLTYGKDDTASPQHGDIVVVYKGGQDHVGFLQSIDPKGNVQVLGGNTADRVGTATYSASQVLGIRRPPTPAESATDDQKAAEQAQHAFDQSRLDRARDFAAEIQKGLDAYDAEQRKIAEDIKRRAAEYQKVIDEQKVSGQLLQAEAGMVGMSRDQRQKALEVLKMELDLQEKLGPEYAERTKQIGAEALAQDDLRRHLDQIEAAYDELRQTGEQVLDDLFNPSNWNNWGDLGKRVLQELESEFIKLAALNPLKNLLFGENLPTLASTFAGLFGGATAPASDALMNSGIYDGIHFASGTESAPGGLAWVGEFGKELVRLPKGSKVTPANESRRIAAANDGGIGSITFYMPVDATGADPAAIARLNTRLDQMQASIPGQVIAAWSDARDRFKFG